MNKLQEKTEVSAKDVSGCDQSIVWFDFRASSSCSAKVLLGWVFCWFSLQVQPRLINPLKNLRRLGLKLVAEFFSDYETYSFSAEEIDAVFHAVVWPQVSISSFSK